LNPWLLIAAMIAFGFCKGLYDANLTPAFYDVIPARERSSATGLMNLIGFIGAGLGSIAIGVAVDAGVPMSLAIGATGGIYILIAGVLWLASGQRALGDIDRATLAS
jgi:hypothetical protein